MKCGYVTIIGRPNAGKSSLINALLRTHALIISPKAQTTRNSIRCIYNNDDAQIIFTDTPGHSMPHDKLGKFLNDEIIDAVDNCDVVIWLIDAGSRKLQPDDLEIANMLSSSKPVILAANKSDKANPECAFRLYEKIYDFAAKFAISAKYKKCLDNLLSATIQLLPDGEPVYDPDILMDTTERFMAAEIIREKILMLLHDEIPHRIAVMIDEYKSPDEFPGRKKLYIRASLITESLSHKKIIIGNNGSMIKRIGESARVALENISGFGVYMDLWVKVVPGWRKNPNALRSLGYA